MAGQGVQFQMIEQTTDVAAVPGASGSTYNVGINAPGGPVEFLVIRGDVTYAADPCASDFTTLLSTIRVVINGDVVHDFRAGYTGAAVDGAGLYGYLLNSIGGRAYEDPGGTTTREFYWGIPLGRNTPEGVNRYEIAIDWVAGAGAAAATASNLSFWLKMNPNVQKTTTCVPSTSFAHAASIEQVVVRIPQNVPGVVSAIMMMNDSPHDELDTQGVRIQALGPYGFEPTMWRWLNGDLDNGIAFANPTGGSITQQTYATQVKGAILLPCFGLKGGDVVLQVDSSEITTRVYQPIITHQLTGREAPEVRQTQAAPGNTAQTILKRTEN